MKIRLTPIAAILSLSGMMTMPVSAASNASLQATVSHLEKEVAALKHQVASNNNSNNNSHAVAPSADKSAQPGPRATTQVFTSSGQSVYLPFDPDVPGQALVSTGPYVGVEFQFAGTDLIVNSPSVNTDVQLLSIRKNIINRLNAMQTDMDLTPTHSHVLLSGVLEAQASYSRQGGEPIKSDIDVTNVSLDTTILGPSDWITGFVELSYNNGTPLSDVFVSTNNYRISDSHVYVNKAFITLGDFNRSPLYTTFGQFYVPFGAYSSVMVSDTLPKLMARTKARSILVGMQQQGDNAFYASGYIFAGDSHEASISRINNGGVNAGYKFNAGFLRGVVGGGVIGNIADSAGMQLGAGFNDYEQLIHRVPAYDLRTSLSLGDHIDFIGEYISATTSFNPFDMSYNNQGAKPTALDLEAAYSFAILDNKPSSIGVGYGKTTEALALGLPLSRTSVVFNTSLMRNTIQSLEFRHDKMYAASAVASGAGDTTSPSENGRADNTLTAQFDYYF